MNASNPKVLLQELAEFSMAYSKIYLASGGPTSRMEEQVENLSKAFGVFPDVYATPTGVFLSFQKEGTDKENLTRIGRIRDQRIHFKRLKALEDLIATVRIGKLTFNEGLERLLHLPKEAPDYSLTLQGIAAFVVGFASSYPRYGHVTGALLSALLVVTVFLLLRFWNRILRMPGVFLEFLACLFALSMAGLLGKTFQIPPDIIALGTIIYLVPGLQLTNAVSELAEHNFVSGTAKLMKAMLTLFAMGLAYLLVLEVAEIFLSLSPAKFSPALSSRSLLIGSNVLLVLAFSVVFQIPMRALWGVVIVGALGNFLLYELQNPKQFVMASFLTSFVVGVFSLILGRITRMPSQTYSVPGVLSLLPGMLALSSFQSFVVGKEEGALALGFRVLLVSISISFGLIASRIFKTSRFG